MSWLTAADTRSTIFMAVVIAVSIIVSGLIAAAIGRSGVKHLIAQRDREQRSAAIATLIDAATEATVWNALTPQERVLADRAVGQADTTVRLLPVRGSSIAADWASHQLAEMKRASTRNEPDLAPVIGEFRDRLLDWQERPGRAKKIFQSDLERWAFGDSLADPVPTGQTAKADSAAGAPAHLPDPVRTDATTQKLIDDVAALDAAKKRQVSPPADEDEKTA